MPEILTLKRPRTKPTTTIGEATRAAGVKTHGKPNKPEGPNSGLRQDVPPDSKKREGVDDRVSRKVLLKTLDKLAKDYPAAFDPAEPRKPLKRGVLEDLVAAGYDADILRAVLAFWTNSDQYLEAIGMPRNQRHDLDGKPVEDIPAWHTAWANGRLYERRRLKNRKCKNALKAERGKVTAYSEV